MQSQNAKLTILTKEDVCLRGLPDRSANEFSTCRGFVLIAFWIFSRNDLLSNPATSRDIARAHAFLAPV